MKYLIVLSALLGAALAAPSGITIDGDLFGQHEAVQSGAAVGSFSGRSMPLVLYNHVPQPHGGLQHRADDQGSMREQAWARSYYGSYAEPHAQPALGLFPHARLGGCAVPLLASCSPNIVSGHLVKSHAYPSYSAPSYRSTEQELQIEGEMKEDINRKQKNLDPDRSSTSGTEIQHVASANAPHHQNLFHGDHHMFLGALPQSETHMRHMSHI